MLVMLNKFKTYTALVYHLYNIKTTPKQHNTTFLQHYYNIFATLLQHFYNNFTTFIHQIIHQIYQFAFYHSAIHYISIALQKEN